MFREKFFTFLGVVLLGAFAIFIFSNLAVGADPVLNVTRGGTGTNVVTPGQFLVGESIDHLIATSSILMDMDSGAISIGNVTIDAMSPGDFHISGDLGISTTTPQVDLSVVGLAGIFPAGTATTTCSALIDGALMYSTTSAHFYGCIGSTWTQLDN